MRRELLTAEALRSILAYDSETGVFTRLVTRGSALAGSTAGHLDHKGYLRIRVLDRNYLCHRLAWLYTNGQWPSKDLDHINRVKTDNRIANLREATYSENNQNRPIYRNNTSGYKGVCWHKASSRWAAKINMGGKQRSLGLFKTKEEAYTAYLAAAAVAHTHNPLLQQGAKA